MRLPRTAARLLASPSRLLASGSQPGEGSQAAQRSQALHGQAAQGTRAAESSSATEGGRGAGDHRARYAAMAGLAAALVLALAGAAISGLLPGSRASSAAAAGVSATRRVPSASGQVSASRPHAAASPQQHAASARPASQGAAKRGGADGSRSGGGAAPRTSCTSVAHIGDSTSVDLISPQMLPDRAERLPARYAAVGVRHLRVDASGGRSVVEELPGQQNGYTVASAWRHEGYHGCWVFALGTNDAANVTAGSTVSLTDRIRQMMSVAGGEPVLWVNTTTMLQDGPWSRASERAWDSALTAALRQYPNLRIFDWAAVAKPAWFLPDGIHYNSAGCAHRAAAIAGALARAFPAGGHGHGRIVR
jgi:hypothetical protein